MATTWTPSEIKSIATKIQSQCDVLNNNISTIASLLEETKNAWSGADSTSFYNKAIENHEGIKLIVNIMGEMPEYLNKIASQYKNTEENFTNI